jgi:hypothetical protein
MLTAVALNSVSLSWIASVSPNLMSYKIYRGVTSGGPYVLLTTVGLVTTYIDYNVQASQTYYYVATAIDETGAESAYSNAASVVIPSPKPQMATVTLVPANPPPALLTLTSSQNSSVVGQPVTFTVTVSAAVGSSLNVAFYDGTTLLGIATAQNGQASLTTSALPAGSHAIVAQVPGTDVHLTIGQVVNGRPTATTISAAPSPAVSGQPIALTAQVGPVSGPPNGIPPPTGQVTFQDNGSPVGTANLTATAATLTVNDLPTGAHQFTAIYSGDKFWGSSFGRISDGISAPPLQLSSAAAPLSSSFSPDQAVSIFNVLGLTGETTSSLPLGVSLGGVSVAVTDSAGVNRPALIYGVYAATGQINLV